MPASPVFRSTFRAVPPLRNPHRAGLSRRLAVALIALFAVFASMDVLATTITYQASFVSGSTWRYDYTVANNGAITGEVRLFDILFNPALYDEPTLVISSASGIAAGWDEQILASGLLVPAAYDVLAKGGGITTGGSVSGFAIQFHWLGTGTPGAQGFEIYDSVTFDRLGTGTTVPLPASAALLVSGLLGLVAAARRRRIIR